MPASTVTTFAIFRSLLTRAINEDESLDDATRASILTRLTDMARAVPIVLDHRSVASTGGFVTVDELLKSIEVGTGVSGANRVEWDAISFVVPVTIAGTLTNRGWLPGHKGNSVNPATADTDVTLQYRLTSADPWAVFDRSTVLEEVTSIQFAATVADQVADTALTGLVLVAQQV